MTRRYLDHQLWDWKSIVLKFAFCPAHWCLLGSHNLDCSASCFTWTHQKFLNARSESTRWTPKAILGTNCSASTLGFCFARLKNSILSQIVPQSGLHCKNTTGLLAHTLQKHCVISLNEHKTPNANFLCSCFESYAENESECPACMPENRSVQNWIATESSAKTAWLHGSSTSLDENFSCVTGRCWTSFVPRNKAKTCMIISTTN